MATSGDLLLATSGDFYMATDIVSGVRDSFGRARQVTLRPFAV